MAPCTPLFILVSGTWNRAWAHEEQKIFGKSLSTAPIALSMRFVKDADRQVVSEMSDSWQHVGEALQPLHFLFPKVDVCSSENQQNKQNPVADS